MRLAVFALLIAAPLAACVSLYDPSVDARADFAKAREWSAASGNAASRSGNAIYREIARYAPRSRDG